ncbi:MAG: sulfatase-like hydrolase/transferase, partial [Planctomycetota bacterium]|nr:sulfatase-like hydrolase/transferase [Planctomycetota bacterium]
MLRHLSTALLALAAISSACANHQSSTPSSAVKRQPNVVFVMADDLGYGELGSFGQQKIRTPRLDKLATQGMRLTRHYCGSPVCAPSRCVLMTGKHPGKAAVRNNKEHKPEGQWA